MTAKNTAVANTSTAKKPAGKRWPWVLLLFLILAALAGGAYLYWLQLLQGGNDKQLAALQTRFTGSAQQTEQLQQQLQGLAERVDGMSEQVQGLAERADNMNEYATGLGLDFSELYQRLNLDTGWALAEVKYLLFIASHRLLLEKDVGTALAALQAADQRLQRLPDPGLLVVRDALIAVINDLQATKQVDITGLNLLLGNLAGRIDKLPLNELVGAKLAAPQDTQDQTPAADGGWNRLAGSVWQELKSLVQISKTDGQGLAVLLPEQRYFLYQNLRLQLEAARLAVLLRDTDAFRYSVQSVIDWLNRYFDDNDTDVSVALDSLQQIVTVDLHPVLPSLARTIAALEAYTNATTATNARTADPTPATTTDE
ncbi:MAG: uroporphyrinogen-III C-methyltransferase [Gammaproteobacteria bacterium]